MYRLISAMGPNIFIVAIVLSLCFLPSYESFQLKIARHMYFHRKLALSSSSTMYKIESSSTIEGSPTGKIGRQASGAVMASMNETIVYSTVCIERDPTPVDFTPLRVDFFARYSAVGQTVGAFHRRDSRGDDTEILVARLIDRPIRPMIVDGWQHETQILSWVLSYDKNVPPEALAICSASAAMCISEVPFVKPIAGVEVGLINGKLKINPTKAEMKNSTLHLTIAGTKDGILMIEGAADFLPEEVMVNALSLGHTAIGEICDAITAFAAVVKPVKKTDTLRKLPAGLVDKMDKAFGNELQKALDISDKHLRGAAVATVENKISKTFSEPVRKLYSGKLDDEESTDVIQADADATLLPIDLIEDVIVATEPEKGFDAEAAEAEASELTSSVPVASTRVQAENNAGNDPVDVKIAIKKLLVRRLRGMILTTGKRSDGRTVEGVRPIEIDTSFLPGAHGSALFTRGETQALATATLGSKAMEAKFETLDELGSKRFYLQYRFPPSSVGEVGRVGGVNRREVGHGNLAERALIPAIPSMNEFPYSIRAESLITESCGSSSMATVCGCCLAMLDAGVPLKKLVAGVAMGLILGEKEDDSPVILTDILGLEDALGTMDFKVAGDEDGITTFQLDIKSEGLTLSTLESALMQAKRGRLHILSKMKAILDSPRPLKDSVPKMTTMTVPAELIGKIIGPKGKTIQDLITNNGVTNINLEDDGSIQIESFSIEKNNLVRAAIEKIVEEGLKKDSEKKERAEKKEPTGPPPEVGVIYRDCEVKGVHNFGVFVEILPGYEGLIHVSELDIKKIASPEKAGIVSGQKLDVKFLGKNEKGQMRLSRRVVMLRDAGKEDPSAAQPAASVAVSSASAEAAYS